MSGEKISICQLKNEYEEARFIANIIAKQRDFRELCEMAVFYRTNAQSRAIEEELIRQRIDYKILGSLQFYSRKEIKDLLSYLRLIVNPKDNVAFQRAINTPARGIGKTTLEKLGNFASESELCFYEALLKTLSNGLFTKNTTEKLREFYELIESFRAELLTQKNRPTKIYIRVLNDIGYVEELKKKSPIEARTRAENLNELFNAIENFERTHKEPTLHQFLEELSLIQDSDEKEEKRDAVCLMTLHSSKGLEFPLVFIAGCDEGLFPSSQAINADDKEERLEEERRLAYVGMTRAQEKLYLLHTRIRKFWGAEIQSIPSRFLAELPEDLVEHHKLAYNITNQRKKRKKKRFLATDFHGDDFAQTRPEEPF